MLESIAPTNGAIEMVEFENIESVQRTRAIVDSTTFKFKDGTVKRIRDGERLIGERNPALLTLANLGGFTAYCYPYSVLPDVEPQVHFSSGLDKSTSSSHYRDFYRLAYKVRKMRCLISDNRLILENEGIEALKARLIEKRSRVRYRTFEVQLLEAFIYGYEHPKASKKPESAISHTTSKPTREDYLKRSMELAKERPPVPEEVLTAPPRKYHRLSPLAEKLWREKEKNYRAESE